MPKKISSNPKAVEAKGKKEEAKKGKAAAAEREEEDRAWKEAGEGAKSKAQAKKDEQEKQRAEAAAKKLEAKKLAEEEAASLASSAKKSSSKAAGTPKVTSHQLRSQKETEKQAAAEEAKKRELAAKREVAAEDYGQLVDRENINREEAGVNASGMEAAIAALVIGDSSPEDRHPEKRTRAAYAAWSEQWIADMKMEKPGLRQQQYKDLCWKAWQRSPDNPMNQIKPQA